MLDSGSRPYVQISDARKTISIRLRVPCIDCIRKLTKISHLTQVFWTINIYNESVFSRQIIEKQTTNNILLASFQNMSHRHKSSNHLVQHNIQHHRKIILSGFHLNGHTLGFHPQTQRNTGELQVVIQSCGVIFQLLNFTFVAQ